MRFCVNRAIRRIIYRVGVVLGIGIISLGNCAAFGQSGLQSVRPAVQVRNGSLQLVLIQEKSQSRFRVELRNAGNIPLILKMGSMLANGKVQYPDAIHLVLTAPHSKVLHLDLKGPPYVAGRVDPMVVPLPAGATFSVPIDLDDYFSLKEKMWSLYLAPGRYTLSAEYAGDSVTQLEANLDMKGIVLMPYWTGTVDSNKLLFTLDQEIGRQPEH